jgi:hypothetical protein
MLRLLRSVSVVSLAASLFGGCGAAPAEPFDQLCSEQPPPSDTSGVLVTSVGCPFEQQLDNLAHFGTPVGGAGLALSDAQGATGARVTLRCGTWLRAVDAQGNVVVVQSASGEVRSHGLFHAGQPVSQLPFQLSMPLQY